MEWNGIHIHIGYTRLTINTRVCQEEIRGNKIKEYVSVRKLIFMNNSLDI
jgi:hypothetical protein